MNPRARKRFQKLEEELRDGKEGEESKGESGDGGDVGEPEQKKAKVEVAAGGEAEDVELIGSERNSCTVVRGHMKKNFLRDKDGNKHESVGREDFLPCPVEAFDPLRDFYGLTSDTFESKRYKIRACGDSKVLYFMSGTVMDLIDRGIQERVTVVHSGLKAFVRNNKECEVQYRISQEGVHFVSPHMTKRKFSVGVDDFRKCLGSGPSKTIKDHLSPQPSKGEKDRQIKLN